ncbi:MAG TPA: hypothetical protein VHM27_14330 [Rhizomicrobium sp.]|nr:hypothetical protein [Rhizomicrobium sp.]
MMTRSGAASLVLKQPAARATRRYVTLFALLAFLLQSFAVQSHIHPLDKPASVAAAINNIPAPVKKIDPVDLGSCRLCQEIVHAGAFVAPSAFAVPASQNAAIIAFTALPLLAGLLAPAFAWQSRAPPRH